MRTSVERPPVTMPCLGRTGGASLEAMESAPCGADTACGTPADSNAATADTQTLKNNPLTLISFVVKGKQQIAPFGYIVTLVIKDAVTERLVDSICMVVPVYAELQ